VPPGPRIRIVETEFRGQSTEGHLRHDFRVESVGTEPLVLSNVVSSCGCTVATPSRKEIAPGETAIVAVDLHVEPSRRESSVFVRSTDPVTPVVELKIAATDMPDRLIQFVPAVTRIPGAESTEVQSVLKIEQWKKGPTEFPFEDLRFNLSDGIAAVEPAEFDASNPRPLVWDEQPVRQSDRSITVELTDRTVTLIPVRIRLKSNEARSPREFVRVDIPSSQDKVSSSILAIELTAR